MNARAANPAIDDREETPGYSAMDDAALMALVCLGNQEAFAQLVKRHTDQFLMLALRTVNRRHDAEDIVQNAFIKVWQTPEKWCPKRSAFTTWLYKIVLNACYDLERAKSRQSRYQYDASHQVDDGSRQAQDGLAILSERANQRWRTEVLNQAMQTLVTKQRDAINLAVYCALPQQEVANIMGISVKAVESLLVRGKRKLSKYIDKQSERQHGG